MNNDIIASSEIRCTLNFYINIQEKTLSSFISVEILFQTNIFEYISWECILFLFQNLKDSDY